MVDQAIFLPKFVRIGRFGFLELFVARGAKSVDLGRVNWPREHVNGSFRKLATQRQSMIDQWDQFGIIVIVAAMFDVFITSWTKNLTSPIGSVAVW